ncbi:MAG TPA: AmmeMemoRadiSam system radical SAM enzyme [Thermoleophilia bacterium]|nr:AmmeMemoRadiSam system radical SAM enzyme [Thermoleophilia bacterium]
MPDESGHVAILQEPRGDGVVQCHVCPRLCVIRPGQLGVCRARKNRDGTLYSLVYDRVCSVAADPIEKKPLFHFFPGTTVLSLGTLGCNFTCVHCQNWQIAHADASEGLRDLRSLPVDNLPVLARNNECAGVAWTYNEPTIWIEYVIDGARVAHEHGLYTVMVTNGYITTDGLDAVAPHLDAYRVDVKGFDDELYRRLCRVPHHEPVLAAAERALHEHGCHVEIVTNVIPTLNDDEATLRGIARWMVDRLGPKTPWHVTRFHPYLELSHLPATPIATLEQAVAFGHDEGLDFVYVGNVPGHEGENTVCPHCHRLVVRRTGYAVEDVALRQGHCDMCGEDLNVRETVKKEPTEPRDSTPD